MIRDIIEVSIAYLSNFIRHGLLDHQWLYAVLLRYLITAVFMGCCSYSLKQCILYAIPLHTEFEESGESIGSRSAL